MEYSLTGAEVRVLGALIEKELTTPDYYPLSLNALVAACNQTSNRNPVTQFDETTVATATDNLREKNLVHRVERGDTRVVKYRHVMYEALDLRRPAIAALTVLMLRGPQTVGEIRTRSGRLYDFSSLEEVEATLTALAGRPTPLVIRLPRQSGQKEVRYAHLLSGDVKFIEPETEPEIELDRISKLEKELEDLRKEFEEFRSRFE